MMPPFRSLLEELSLLLGRTLTLGEAASRILARLVAILGFLVLGWIMYHVDASDPVLRLYARVSALQKVPLELEVRRRVKEAFDAAGVHAPRAQLLVRLDAERSWPLSDPNRKESPA